MKKGFQKYLKQWKTLWNKHVGCQCEYFEENVSFIIHFFLGKYRISLDIFWTLISSVTVPSRQNVASLSSIGTFMENSNSLYTADLTYVYFPSSYNLELFKSSINDVLPYLNLDFYLLSLCNTLVISLSFICHFGSFCLETLSIKRKKNLCQTVRGDQKYPDWINKNAPIHRFLFIKSKFWKIHCWATYIVKWWCLDI